MNTSTIQCLINARHVEIKNVEPTRSVLNYLRYELNLIGSKEGCAEGDCGACTVVMAELSSEGLQFKAVNACIQFVPALQGKALFTVEYLRQHAGGLHPVQQAMVDCHGSQCGFCTPGFIMSLWAVYLDHQRIGSCATDDELRTALSGNLCRCTGYRPILEAGQKMFRFPLVEFDSKAVIEQLKAFESVTLNEYRFSDQTFYTPKTMAELIRIKKSNPQATILSGCTDIGLWVNKGFKELGDIIYLGSIDELKQVTKQNNHLSIGAGVSLDEAFKAIAEYYPQIKHQWLRFASLPIRNAGTLGGNIANGSPIGDSMPILIALSCVVKLTGPNGSRKMLLEDLYIDYMQNAMNSDEILDEIIIPIEQPSLVFRTYKLSKRFDSDISAVCAAFSLNIEHNEIKQAKIAFGGMAAIPKRAVKTEAELINKQWNEQTANNAMQSLGSDFSPLSDMRASADYRLQCAENLIYRFYLETRPDNPMPSNDLCVFEDREVQ